MEMQEERKGDTIISESIYHYLSQTVKVIGLSAHHCT